MTASLESQIQEMLAMMDYDPDGAKLASAVNGVAQVVLPADTSGGEWHIDTVTVSYSAEPTNGLLTVYAGATPIFQTDITAAGPTTLAVFKRSAGGGALSVALSAGGSGITGRVNVNAKLV